MCMRENIGNKGELNLGDGRSGYPVKMIYAEEGHTTTWYGCVQMYVREVLLIHCNLFSKNMVH